MSDRERCFLILHGWQNHRPPEHWQHWLAGRLRATGEDVRYPQLPDPDAPSATAWLRALREELRMMPGERVVICHSLAGLLWLQHARTGTPDPVDRVLLVAPPSPAALPSSLSAFFPAPAADDPAALAGSARHGVELVCSDADPWCPEGGQVVFGDPLGLPTHVIPGAGHLAVPDGFGPWPAVEEWARSGRPMGARPAYPSVVVSITKR